MRRLQKPQRIRKSDEKETKGYRCPPPPTLSKPFQYQFKNIMTPQLSRVSDFNRKQTTPPHPYPPPPAQLINKDRCLRIKRYCGAQRETTLKNHVVKAFSGRWMCFETGNDMLAYIIFEHAGWDCFTTAWLVARVA